MRTNHLAESIVHTAVEGDGSRATVVCALRRLSAFGGFSRLCRGGHVDAGAERSTAVGRGAYATLHINGGHAASHVSHIDPENGLTFTVVEWHIIERHVDTGVIRTADAEIGIAYS